MLLTLSSAATCEGGNIPLPDALNSSVPFSDSLGEGEKKEKWEEEGRREAVEEEKEDENRHNGNLETSKQPALQD